MKHANKEQKERRSVVFVRANDFDTLCAGEYVSLDKNPEIMTACKKIAELIGSMTIHLMSNTEKGDIRIVNELSRKIDIEPNLTMTRSHWMQAIVMNLLLYGKGNSVVIPHTYGGTLQSLEPVSASRVQFVPKGGSFRDYRIVIDGRERDPRDLLHFVYNPDPLYMWKGRGVAVVLKEIANNLKQATETERGFMQSKWKPSLIIKVDGMIDEFSDKAGRQKILEDYVKAADVGEPWLIPAEQFQVEQVRPLSLADIAIKDTVELDKKTVASVLGVPSFLLGLGGYNQQEWNNFIQNTVGVLAKNIEQEMTRKLILSPKWYLRFNMLSLMDYNIGEIYSVYSGLANMGIVTPNEVRDRLGLPPLDGLDGLRILENYIPADMIGNQSKLTGGTDGTDQ